MNTIDIHKKNGTTTTMEIVTVFKIDKFNSNYIIYRELDKSKNYIARFKGNKSIDLDTNLSSEELELCNKFFERMMQHE